ncbi:hypothetical protein WA158_004874 [Blastocystis sp. Blastoise]
MATQSLRAGSYVTSKMTETGRTINMETCDKIEDVFGMYCFNDEALRSSVPKHTYDVVQKARKCSDCDIDKENADVIAHAIMRWAQSHGVTHYSHWFQPLTGQTAQKQDAFLNLQDGKVVSNFTGSKLIKGEPDASSFPNGGLRETHIARGYTVWDPNSYPVIVKHGNGGTLYIPSVFLSWTGKTLDQKIPLLRSLDALTNETKKLFKVIGRPQKEVNVFTGAEQEFFLVDRDYYNKRIDLQLTGRTIFGAAPAKGQELHDQYFADLSVRMIDCIHEAEIEMWKVGIMTVTRHREVAPGQYEVAPLYTNSMLATDQNLLTMDILRRTAHKHGLKVLYHEKPFAGVNGSGKHNNFSIGTDEIPCLFTPGEKPEENIPFMIMIAAAVRSVDMHGDLLRACVAGASNDHRLGANEAPPAIMSCFLGTDVSAAVDKFLKKTVEEQPSLDLDMGVVSLPHIRRGGTDRNRTSPFAFTENKFEFRAAGSSQPIARSNIILNTIFADSIRYIANEIEARKVTMDTNSAIAHVIQDIFIKHQRAIFNGNNYSEEWRQKAHELGLPENRQTPEAIAAFASEKNEKLFSSFGIYTKEEVQSRANIQWDQYTKEITVEAKLYREMLQDYIIPAAFKSQTELCGSIISLGAAAPEINKAPQLSHVACITESLNASLKNIDVLTKVLNELKNKPIYEAQSIFCRDEIKPLFDGIREHGDRLETLIGSKAWPLPSYDEMLFKQS